MKDRRVELVLTCFCLALFNLAHAQDLRFTSSIQTTNVFSMQWSNAVAGQSYTLQSRGRMTNSIWLTIDSPQPWPTVQTQWNDTISSTQLMRLYRVVAVQPATRGKLLSSNLLQSYTASQLTSIFSGQGLPLTALYGLKWYKVVYETIDPIGGRTAASGGLFLPQNVGKSLPLFSFSHGTTTLTNAVASNLNQGDYLAGLVFGSAGYASVVADLLGLGSSPGFHPYLHARSEATASVDMLRAARRFCASNSIGLNGQVFLAGYSHGGHTAMALHRELEEYHTGEFTITASAPLAPGWTDLIVSPYGTTIPPLFNGNTGGGTINGYMPACSMASILVPEVISSLTNDPGCPLFQALRDNDLYRWRPVAPTRMYHCSGDQDVLPANSQVAYNSFLAQGASQVQLIDPAPGANHGGCVLPALAATKMWFDSLKQ